jgi:hypothetical protein
VTATEAERNRRRSLTPWWRVRSWSKDLDTLIRLHKSLRALDADADAEQAPLSAPVLLAPPADMVAPPPAGVRQQLDEAEPPPLPDQASDPAAAYPQKAVRSPDPLCEEAPGQEVPAGQLLSPEARQRVTAIPRTGVGQIRLR